jgi:hypothetical protein
MARNKLEFPDETGPLQESWLVPIQTFMRVMPVNAYSRFFDVDDFMIMARKVRSGRPSIVLYKHRHTRRYLNLDADGRTYRYLAPRANTDGDGRYVAEPNVDRALGSLELWLLPWMKPELALFRRGLDWEERWRLDPELEGDDWLDDEEAGGGPRGEVTDAARVYCFKTRRRLS